MYARTSKEIVDRLKPCRPLRAAMAREGSKIAAAFLAALDRIDQDGNDEGVDGEPDREECSTSNIAGCSTSNIVPRNSTRWSVFRNPV